MGTRFKDEMWMSKDPCGLLCSTFVHWLIFAAGYCVNANVLKPWLGYTTAGVINSVVFNALLFLALVVRPLAHAASPWLRRRRRAARCVSNSPSAAPAPPPQAHFNAMTTNPGAVPKDAMPLPAYLRRTKGVIRRCNRSGPFAAACRRPLRPCPTAEPPQPTRQPNRQLSTLCASVLVACAVTLWC